MARSGAARVKEPKFFEQLDIFLGDQPEAVGIDGAIDTLSSSISAEKENTSDCDIDINCGTISQLRSSGIHASDDGCIGVFADGDDFECSACGCTKAGTFLCLL